MNLGYRVNAASPVAVSTGIPVTWQQTPTHAYVAFNWSPDDQFVPDVSVNGGPFHSTTWPFDPVTNGWRTIAVEVPLSEVHTGINTITFRTPRDTVVSNVNILLIAAAPVPQT
jgi:hypothetical protein